MSRNESPDYSVQIAPVVTAADERVVKGESPIATRRAFRKRLIVSLGNVQESDRARQEQVDFVPEPEEAVQSDSVLDAQTRRTLGMSSANLEAGIPYYPRNFWKQTG